MIFFIVEISLGVRSYVDNFSTIISAIHERHLKSLLKALHLRHESQASAHLITGPYTTEKYIFIVPSAKSRSADVGRELLSMVKRMTKDQLARRLAKQSRISVAAAADQLDDVLSSVLRRVRQGHSASLPGLGTFLPGPNPAFYFEQCLPPGARRTPSTKNPRKSRK
jgi:hypothetical protein